MSSMKLQTTLDWIGSANIFIALYAEIASSSWHTTQETAAEHWEARKRDWEANTLNCQINVGKRYILSVLRWKTYIVCFCVLDIDEKSHFINIIYWHEKLHENGQNTIRIF